MVEGFSPYQLAFGRQPCLPTLVEDLPGALERKAVSKSLAEMISNCHLAGQAFRQVQADKNIRKALASNIKPAGRKKECGELVSFWRLGDSGWKGPGRVVATDDHLVTVRISNQKYDVRHEDCVSVGEEYQKLRCSRD